MNVLVDYSLRKPSSHYFHVVYSIINLMSLFQINRHVILKLSLSLRQDILPVQKFTAKYYTFTASYHFPHFITFLSCRRPYRESLLQPAIYFYLLQHTGIDSSKQVLVEEVEYCKNVHMCTS